MHPDGAQNAQLNGSSATRGVRTFTVRLSRGNDSSLPRYIENSDGNTLAFVVQNTT